MTSARSAARAVDWAVIVTFAIAAIGVVARLRLEQWGIGEPARNNIFWYLFVQYEGPFLALLALGALAVGLANASAQRRRDAGDVSPVAIGAPSRRSVALVAIVVLVLSVAVWTLVMHRYLFSMDEYSADFQARIFARGETAAELRQPWRSLGLALTPTFVYLDFGTGRWLSQYLPGYSALKTPFILAHAGWLLNPLLAAFSIVLIAAIARRLWPSDGAIQWIAIALLATSSEFVLTSGTGYSMPAHLCLNLLWLWLYLRGDARSWALALAVGLVALELHSPFPHALFVAPFLFRLLRERRWGRIASAAVVYGIGSAAGLAYLRYLHPMQRGPSGGFSSLFEMPGPATVIAHLVNASVLLSWQAPVVGVLALTATLRPRHLGPVLTDLAVGLALTLLFFMWFPLTQGHGWGYRYAYQVIGNLALLGAAGVRTWRESLGDARTRVVVGAGVAVALCIQLPVRLVEVSRFVEPFAAANAYVQSRPARVVVVDGESVWYGVDLVRNDPFLAPGVPAVLRARFLAPGAVDAIRRVLPNRVVVVSDDELVRIGLIRTRPRVIDYR